MGRERGEHERYMYIYMEEHVHSILAIKKEKKHIKVQTKTRTQQHRTHTNRKREVGPWVPTLKNWGGRLKSLLRAQLSLHVHPVSQPTILSRKIDMKPENSHSAIQMYTCICLVFLYMWKNFF